jgi:hypothetical protein
MRYARFQVLGVSLLLLISAACKKSDSSSEGSPAPTTAATPAATPVATPAAPAEPPPPFSAAQKLGMFAYPTAAR